MPSASWTLKVEFQGERRRLKDWVPMGEEPTVALVCSGAVLLFEIPSCNDKALKLQYRDNDGEVCTLTDMTLPDALCLAVESRTLRVMVCVPEAVQFAEQAGASSAVDRVRVNLQHLSTSASSGFQAGAEQLRTNISSSVQDGRIRAHEQAQQFGANIQESRASLRTNAEQFVEDFGIHLQTKGAGLRATVGQISSEIQTNLQEGREGFKIRSEQLSGDLCEGTLQLRQSLTKSVDGLMTGENSPEVSKARMASAVVAGGATLVVTRSLPLAVTLGVIVAGGAGVAALRAENTQESTGSESDTSDVARPTAELSASDAEELIDSDVISLPSSSVGENDVQDMQTAVVDTTQAGEEDGDNGMVLVHFERGSASGHSSEAAVE